MCRRRHRLRLCSRAPKHAHKKNGSHTHTGSVHRVGVPVLRSRRPYHPPRFLRRIRLHSWPQSRDMMSWRFCYWDKLDVEVNPPPLHLSHTALTSLSGSSVTATCVTSYPRGQRVCIPLMCRCETHALLTRDLCFQLGLLLPSALLSEPCCLHLKRPWTRSAGLVFSILQPP